MRQIVAIVAMVGVLSACMTPVPPEAKTRTYDASQEEVFRAVQRVYQEQGIRITAGGLEDGYLNGRMSTGTTGVILTGSAVNATYDVTFYETDGGTEVQAYIGSESQGVVYEMGVESYEAFWSQLDEEL